MIQLVLTSTLFVNFVIGSIFFLKNENKLNRWLFGFFYLNVNLWILSLIMIDRQSAAIWGQLAFIAGHFMMLGALLFAHLFNKKPDAINWKQLWYVIPVTLFNILITFNFDLIISAAQSENGQIISVLGPWYPVHQITVLSLETAAITTLITRIIKEKNIVIKTQLKYITFGISFFLLSSLITQMILPSLGIFKYNLIAPILTIPMFISVGYAITHHRFLDLNLLFQKMITYSTIALLGMGISTLFIDESSPYFELKNQLTSATLLILTIFYFEKVFHVSERLLAQFSPSKMNYKKILGRMSEKMANTLDVSEIINMVNRQVPATLSISNPGHLYLKNHQGSFASTAQKSTIIKNPTLIEHFKSQSNSLTIDEVEAELSSSNAGHEFTKIKRAFEALGAELVVPLKRENELIGLYVLEKDQQDHSSKTLFATQQLKEVETFLNDVVSTAIGNAQKYQSLKNRFKAMSEEENEMIQSMYHEFNTPLSIIKGNLDLLRLQTKDKPLEELNEVEKSLSDVTSMTNRLIETIHMDRVNLKDLKVEKLKIASMVDATLQEIEPECDVEHVRTSKMATGVEELIKKMLTEVLKNASFYADKKISIRYRVTQENLVLIIENDGPPMSEKDLKNVFNKFYRSDQSRTKKTGGAGLGLTLANKIAKKHKGSISIENRTDTNGVRVSITLPK